MSRSSISTGIALVLAFISLHSHATSFDCAKAVSFAEKSICADTALSLLDEQLNSQYVRALDSAANRNQVRIEQREWLRLRDNCVTDSCLSTSMSQRLNQLSGAIPQSARPAPTSDIKRAEPRVPAATAQVPAVASPVPANSNAQDNHRAVLYLKIALFCMAVLLLICIWLHRRGSMTIYQDYTDALFTSITPILGIGSYFVFSVWLEIPKNYALIAACVLAGLMLLQVIIQTYRSNGVSLFFLLSLFAKIALLTFYFLMMALLLCGGARTRQDARRRRGWAVFATTAFVFLSGWMCRNRQFSSIDDYIAGRT
ncbi:lysozyme inhibitor LprI family protein [Pseudomonas allokribbensis]|uniref:lysozyme inhibitor LprI family protein n=1 Tax=Pseudomonas allokribbensis TaxID=2774460 RepID=UPI0017887615|nr:lysozyme inhibitor LprI family protein [Pseudomonas allokribbensis]